MPTTSIRSSSRRMHPIAVGATILACAAGAGCGAAAPKTGDLPTTPFMREPPATIDPAAAWPQEVTLTHSGGPDAAAVTDPIAEENFVHLVSTFTLPGATTSERIIPIRASTITVSFEEGPGGADAAGEDGTISLTGTLVELPDIVVGVDTFPPDGIVITALALTAGDIIDVPYQQLDDDLRYVETSLAVTLSWGLLDAAGEIYYLAPVTIADVPAAVTITRDPDTHRIEMTLDALASNDPIANSLVTVHEAGLSLSLASAF